MPDDYEHFLKAGGDPSRFGHASTQLANKYASLPSSQNIEDRREEGLSLRQRVEQVTGLDLPSAEDLKGAILHPMTPLVGTNRPQLPMPEYTGKLSEEAGLGSIGSLVKQAVERNK